MDDLLHADNPSFFVAMRIINNCYDIRYAINIRCQQII